MNRHWTRRTEKGRLPAGSGASRPRSTTAVISMIEAVMGAMVIVVLFAAATPAIGVHRFVAPGTASGRVMANALVGIFLRTSTGEYKRNGTGFFVKPGILVAARDDRRAGTDVFVSDPRSVGYLAAKPIAAAHPTDLDVYAVDGVGPATLRLAESAVTTGDSVYLSAFPSWPQPATVRSIQDDVFAITLTQPPLSNQPTGPVMLEDGTVVGLSTTMTIRDNEYLVVPVTRIKARLAGLPEPGPAVSSLDATPTFRAEGPPASSASMSESRVPNDSPPPPPKGGAPLPDRPRITRVSGGVLAGKATRKPQPPFPEEARAAGVEGVVVVEVTVSEAGDVQSARVVSGPPLLRDAAVQAAREWAFHPTTIQGYPVKVIGTITFAFWLRPPPAP